MSNRHILTKVFNNVEFMSCIRDDIMYEFDLPYSRKYYDKDKSICYKKLLFEYLKKRFELIFCKGDYSISYVKNGYYSSQFCDIQVKPNIGMEDRLLCELSVLGNSVRYDPIYNMYTHSDLFSNLILLLHDNIDFDKEIERISNIDINRVNSVEYGKEVLDHNLCIYDLYFTFEKYIKSRLDTLLCDSFNVMVFDSYDKNKYCHGAKALNNDSYAMIKYDFNKLHIGFNILGYTPNIRKECLNKVNDILSEYSNLFTVCPVETFNYISKSGKIIDNMFFLCFNGDNSIEINNNINCFNALLRMKNV